MNGPSRLLAISLLRGDPRAGASVSEGRPNLPFLLKASLQRKPVTLAPWPPEQEPVPQAVVPQAVHQTGIGDQTAPAKAEPADSEPEEAVPGMFTRSSARARPVIQGEAPGASLDKAGSRRLTVVQGEGHQLVLGLSPIASDGLVAAPDPPKVRLDPGHGAWRKAAADADSLAPAEGPFSKRLPAAASPFVSGNLAGKRPSFVPVPVAGSPTSVSGRSDPIVPEAPLQQPLLDPVSPIFKQTGAGFPRNVPQASAGMDGMLPMAVRVVSGSGPEHGGMAGAAVRPIAIQGRLQSAARLAERLSTAGKTPVGSTGEITETRPAEKMDQMSRKLSAHVSDAIRPWERPTEGPVTRPSQVARIRQLATTPATTAGEPESPPLEIGSKLSARSSRQMAAPLEQGAPLSDSAASLRMPNGSDWRPSRLEFTQAARQWLGQQAQPAPAGDLGGPVQKLSVECQLDGRSTIQLTLQASGGKLMVSMTDVPADIRHNLNQLQSSLQQDLLRLGFNEVTYQVGDHRQERDGTSPEQRHQHAQQQFPAKAAFSKAMEETDRGG